MPTYIAGSTDGADLLLVAGGTGLAALLVLVERVAASPIKRRAPRGQTGEVAGDGLPQRVWVHRIPVRRVVVPAAAPCSP